MFHFRINGAPSAATRRTKMSIAVPAQQHQQYRQHQRIAFEPMSAMSNGVGGALSNSMIGRIYSTKPGCSSCGKRVA